jgi:gliding motility-associated-like protein
MVTVVPAPVISAAAVPTECGTSTSIRGLAPVVAQFSNASNGANRYLWEFGDGATSTDPGPAHQYSQEGEYEIYLTAYSENSCFVRQRIAGAVVEKTQQQPNVFTPNGDGLNDTFAPRVSCLPVDLKVFNRWGKLVYEEANYQSTWNGGNLADGVYYYLLSTVNGQAWKGWVEIIR